jgi:hypothetical protein
VRVYDDEVNYNNTETTEVFKTLLKRLKHAEQTIDNEFTKTYERFVPERWAISPRKYSDYFK